MPKQKRSKNINTSALRKSVSIKPLAIGAASILMSACSQNTEDASIYLNSEDCSRDNPNFTAVCETTYQQALQEAQDTAPKYATLADCEYDFGADACQAAQSNNPEETSDNRAGNSFFMPMMAGYMLGRMGSGSMRSGSKNYAPMFTSKSGSSPLRGKWFSSDGTAVGNFNTNKNYRVKQSFFNPRPSTTSTLRRGGFGNMARAKAARASSSKGWGG